MKKTDKLDECYDEDFYEIYDSYKYLKVVDIETLKKMSYEDGVNLLQESGYFCPNGCEDRDAIGCDYIYDEYYKLIDDDGDTVHLVSYAKHMNRNNDPLNDDGSLDYIISEGWEEVENNYKKEPDKQPNINSIPKEKDIEMER